MILITLDLICSKQLHTIQFVFSKQVHIYWVLFIFRTKFQKRKMEYVSWFCRRKANAILSQVDTTLHDSDACECLAAVIL